MLAKLISYFSFLYQTIKVAWKAQNTNFKSNCDIMLGLKVKELLFDQKYTVCPRFKYVGISLFIICTYENFNGKPCLKRNCHV